MGRSYAEDQGGDGNDVRGGAAPGRATLTSRLAGRGNGRAADDDAAPPAVRSSMQRSDMPDAFGVHLGAAPDGDGPAGGGGPGAGSEPNPGDADVLGNPLRGLRFNDGNPAEKFRRQLAGAVGKLRERLRRAMPDFTGLGDGTVYDQDVMAALKEFKRRNDLRPSRDDQVDDATAQKLWFGDQPPPDLKPAQHGDNPLEGLRPGDGAVPGRDDPATVARVKQLQEKLNLHVPATLVVDGRFLLDNDTLLTYHKLQREIGEAPDNGAVTKRAAELLWFGVKKDQKPEPPKPGPKNGPAWDPTKDPFIGLTAGDGATPDTLERKPYVRRMQEILNDKMTAGLATSGVFDDETLAVLHHFQKKSGTTVADFVDADTSAKLQAKGDQPPNPKPVFDPELEGLINALWLQLQLDLFHAMNAIEQLRADLKSPPKFVFWKALAKWALRLPIASLFGDGFPNMIANAVFVGGDNPLVKQAYTDRVIKPPFDAIKDTIGDTIQSFIDSKADSTNADQQLDNFVVAQKETAVHASGLIQEEFLLKSAKAIRELDGDRVAYARGHLEGERKSHQGFFDKQYAASLQAWATMLAHKELNPAPPKGNDPGLTGFKEDPNTDRKVDGVMDASFDGNQDEPARAVTLVSKPTIRGIPEEAAIHFKGRTFGELSGMPLVARVHVARRGAETYDLFVEATERAEKAKDKPDDPKPTPIRGVKWMPEDAANRDAARAYLSAKDAPGIPANDSNAEFGALNVLELEIAKIKIEDLEIKS